MKVLLHILFFIFSISMVFGQITSKDSPLFMTEEQNQEWLTNLKLEDKESQWSIISERFFNLSDSDVNADNENKDVPVLIIDGIAINNLTKNSGEKLMILLTYDKIDDIKILEKEPEGLYVNKKFTGIIIAKLNDKRTSRKVQRIKNKN